MTLEGILYWTNVIEVGKQVVFAIVLPFMLPLTFRLGHVLWNMGDWLGRVTGVGVVVGVAALAGITAGLALLGEFDHFRQKFPEAFGPAIAIGISIAVILVVADFIVGAVQRGQPKSP